MAHNPNEKIARGKKIVAFATSLVANNAMDSAPDSRAFNDLSSLIAYLHSRRSGRPRDMVAPGPDEAQLREILGAATRTPDHGKLAPWRFVVVREDQRDALSALLTGAYQREKPDAGRLEIEAMDNFARQAPALVVALFKPVVPSKIPLWEQQLSMGAACMNLLHGAHALGFVGGWITGWPSTSREVAAAFGAAGPDDRIAGFLFLGSPGRPLEERPRPIWDDVVESWQPGR